MPTETPSVRTRSFGNRFTYYARMELGLTERTRQTMNRRADLFKLVSEASILSEPARSAIAAGADAVQQWRHLVHNGNLPAGQLTELTELPMWQAVAVVGAMIDADVRDLDGGWAFFTRRAARQRQAKHRSDRHLLAP